MAKIGDLVGTRAEVVMTTAEAATVAMAVAAMVTGIDRAGRKPESGAPSPCRCRGPLRLRRPTSSMPKTVASSGKPGQTRAPSPQGRQKLPPRLRLGPEMPLPLVSLRRMGIVVRAVRCVTVGLPCQGKCGCI